MVYSTRRFVLCPTLCYFVLVIFSPFSIAITSLGEERANLSAFRTFVRFVLVWFCRFLLPLGAWEGLRFVIVAFLGLFLTFSGTVKLLRHSNQFYLHKTSPSILQIKIRYSKGIVSVRRSPFYKRHSVELQHSCNVFL